MIGGGRVLGLIPARGGSKGVPRKNLRPLAGRPLIAWTIAAAQRARCLDRVVLSSDDPEIIATAQALGCEAPFVRPAELARDDTPGVAPVLHALECLPGYDWVVLLQPTSPLRRAEDIDACLELCVRSGAPACVSVSAAEHSPYWMFTRGDDGRLHRLLPEAAGITRRQDLPAAYRLNGAVYVARSDWLKAQGSFLGPETLGYVMPAERSPDLDTELDFRVVECLWPGVAGTS